MFCPANISNGALVDCDRLPGKRCNFTCNPGYSKPGGVDQLICMTGGVWHNTNPCQGILSLCEWVEKKSINIVDNIEPRVSASAFLSFFY